MYCTTYPLLWIVIVVNANIDNIEQAKNLIVIMKCETSPHELINDSSPHAP